MLILTRKKDESIILNGNIEIKIIDIEDGKIKLGIEAPREVDIVRKELYDKVEEENKAAISKKIDLGQMKNLLKR